MLFCARPSASSGREPARRVERSESLDDGEASATIATVMAEALTACSLALLKLVEPAPRSTPSVAAVRPKGGRLDHPSAVVTTAEVMAEQGHEEDLAQHEL